MSNLTEEWVEVEVPTPTHSLWKHEWLKHGTCAAVLPTLDTGTSVLGHSLMAHLYCHKYLRVILSIFFAYLNFMWVFCEL